VISSKKNGNIKFHTNFPLIREIKNNGAITKTLVNFLHAVMKLELCEVRTVF